MRQYIIGGLVGAALMLSFNASAAVESIIGKTVEGTAPVKLNGTALDKESIIVDGSSYAPVRVIGESLGLDVDFKNNEVILNKKAKDGGTKVVNPILDENKPKTAEQLDELIKQAKANIWSMKAVIETDGEKNPNYQTYKERLAKYEAELTDLEKQKAELLIQK